MPNIYKNKYLKYKKKYTNLSKELNGGMSYTTSSEPYIIPPEYNHYIITDDIITNDTNLNKKTKKNLQAERLKFINYKTELTNLLQDQIRNYKTVKYQMKCRLGDIDLLRRTFAISTDSPLIVKLQYQLKSLFKSTTIDDTIKTLQNTINDIKLYYFIDDKELYDRIKQQIYDIYVKMLETYTEFNTKDNTIIDEFILLGFEKDIERSDYPEIVRTLTTPEINHQTPPSDTCSIC